MRCRPADQSMINRRFNDRASCPARKSPKHALARKPPIHSPASGKGGHESAHLTITTRFWPSIIAQYPEAAQIDVWGEDPEAVAASSLAPREAARRVPGGWRLSGRYPFSSGCDYAQWGIIGAFLGEKGDPRHIAYLLVPLAEVEIVDDWQVLGLLGTGSKSLVLHDVFVPEHRHVMVSDLFAGTPPGALVHPDYPVLRAPRGFLESYSLPPVAIALV